jgi:hypothetical protein
MWLNKEQLDKAIQKYIDRISPNPNRPQPSPEQQALIKEQLGYCGRMLSGSKQAAKTAGREHLTVFNANLIVTGFGKVWYGDIDITRDEEKLKKIALAFKSVVNVLREHDARFEYENNPQVQNAVYVTDGLAGNWGISLTGRYERVNGKLYAKENR